MTETTLAGAGRRLGLRLATLVAAIVLAACGGGGGGGGGSSAPALQLIADGSGSTTGVVGQPVGQVPGVRVVDGTGAGVAGITVSFQVGQAGASVSPATVSTGADGRARPNTWVLGTQAGVNSLVATAQGVAGERRFTVTAEPGAPAVLAAGSIQQQIGDLGQPVAQPPAVVVSDSFGNRVAGAVVEFSVVQGGGSVAGGSATSDANGIARVEAWTLGPDEGLNELRASLAGAGAVTFTAEALPPVELSIEGVQLNQATQTGPGDITAVAGRPGLLRVIVTATRPNTLTPDVRVRLFRNGTLAWERILPARAASVPQEPTLSSLNSTWNIELTPDEVQPGIAVEALVDPGEELSLPSRENTRFPRGSGQAPIAVEALAPLRVLFIPVQATRHNATGQIFPGNVEDFLVNARLWLPVHDIQPELRSTPFVTDRDLTDVEDIEGLLSDLQAVRTAEAAGDRFYHGIIPAVQDIPVAGIAYVPSIPSSPFRTGLSYDRLPRAAETVAHELAHNFGRSHSPCGSDITGVDPSYPYGDGGIGEAGYHIEEGSLRGPSGYFDYMGYCQPRWTSDYTYRAVLDWFADPRFSALAGDAPVARAAETSGLLLWGRMNSSGVDLNPAFQLQARPVLPEAGGPNLLRGVAVDGEVLFELSFAGEAVPHAADPTERQFSWFVPLSPAQAAVLDRVELITPQGVALQAARGGPPAGAPGLAADAVAAPARHERLPGGGLRVNWDPQQSPVALVRDRRSGHVVGIGRSGELRFDAATAASIEPELLMSDGLRTRLEAFEAVR